MSAAGTIPGTPTLASNLVTISDGVVLLHFDLPESDGGAPLTHCLVKVEPGDQLVEVPPSSPCTLEGLDVNQEYSFAIAAKNILGAGPFSEPTPLVSLLSGGSTMSYGGLAQ